MFVDEAETPAWLPPSGHFVLTGIVIHELRWRSCIENLQDFRRELKNDFGLKLREEIHHRRCSFGRTILRVSKSTNRLAIIRRFADRLASVQGLNVISIHVRKAGKTVTYDVFESAWRALIQRFENTIDQETSSGPEMPTNAGSSCLTIQTAGN